MLTIYENRAGTLTRQKGKPRIGEEAVWIDLLNPTEDEEKKVERALKFDVPTREEQLEIEASSRLYQENGAYFMTATLLYTTEQGDPRTTPATFILAGQRLVTVRYAEPRAFPIFVARCNRTETDLKSGPAVLIGLLETIIDRIHLIDTRFEVLKRDAEIEMLKDSSEGARARYAARVAQLDDDRAFLRNGNIGSERMRDEDVARLERIAGYRWKDTLGRDAPFLSTEEVDNLTIRSGTLTSEERKIINHHIIATNKMLEALPWPKHLRKVPEYAGGHHERMDGKGYPRGLTREQMSIPARVMGIADIFEALTAKDRPYKKGKTLSESLEILGRMKLNHHIDPDLFDIFVRKKVYRRYAEMFLDREQIDEVDESRIPGYQP